jgi:3'-5' exonuclease
MTQEKEILFLDIETVTETGNWEDLDERKKELWKKKASYMSSTEEIDPEALYFEKGAIFAEYGKVVAIAIGMIGKKEGQEFLKVKAFAQEDESQLLEEFANFLHQNISPEKYLLCAHNGKEFDYPYLCRRLLIHGMHLPEILNLENKKPWEVPHLDTLEMWKFGDRKNYTSLDLLAAIFKVDSSKSDMDGSMVNHVYYEEKDLRKIAKYCMMDVVVTVQVYRKMKLLELIPEENIQLVETE